MILVLLGLLVGFAHAGDEALRAAIQRQEAVVDALAAEVATARATGASRQDLGARMSRYRAEAERLAAMEEPFLRSAVDAERAAHSDAERKLADALAGDRPAEQERVLLVHWLGEPRDRIRVFELVPAQSTAVSDPVVRRALALDLAEQSNGLALVCRYDAEKSRREGDRATAQAAALRARTAPGQSGGIDLMVAAERAERQAAQAVEAVRSAEALAARFEAVRTVALALSEGTP